MGRRGSFQLGTAPLTTPSPPLDDKWQPARWHGHVNLLIPEARRSQGAALRCAAIAMLGGAERPCRADSTAPAPEEALPLRHASVATALCRFECRCHRSGGTEGLLRCPSASAGRRASRFFARRRRRQMRWCQWVVCMGGDAGNTADGPACFRARQSMVHVKLGFGLRFASQNEVKVQID